MDLILLKRNPTKTTKLTQTLSQNGASLLLQRADRLGDMILCLPAIESLKKAFPNLKITMICSKRNVQLLRFYPLIDSFYEFNIESTV